MPLRLVTTARFVAGSAIVLARGRFDQVKIEALMREHGATVEQYKDARVILGPEHQGTPISLSFLEPGLAAIGTSNLIHSAVDLKAGGSSITTNDDVMRFVRDLDSGNAWAVGRFDVLASQTNLPAQVSEKLPAIQWFSANAQIDSGVRGVVRAEARDDEAGNALRDVVRGVMALVKLQVPSQPGLDTVVRSLELGGSGKTVTLSFEIPPSVFDMLAATEISATSRATQSLSRRDRRSCSQPARPPDLRHAQAPRRPPSLSKRIKVCR